ncbi:MAG: PatB family C-S lyase [Clostridia bacterium]|nr:PatB family C-S lyase [Clostridia bacterium]
MNRYDFTTVKPDRSTDCNVYTRMDAMGITTPDAIPFAVAEMMFPIAPPILDALHKTADNAYFGYRQNEAPFRQAVCAWMAKKGAALTPEQIVPSHGVVTGLGNAIRAYTQPGDPVLIQPPVYGPFMQVLRENERRIVENPLILRDGRYEMDFADMEQKLLQGVKLFILCSPHNPVGRVWTRAELSRVHALCARFGVPVLSDEIHQDILRPGVEFTPYMLLDPDCAAFSAASKTFNIAGLSQAYFYTKNEEKLRLFENAAKRDSGEVFNPFGMAATAAAYTHGEAWMREMLAVVYENADMLQSRAEALGLPMPRLEGTYLCWLDMRPLGLDAKALQELLVRAGIEATQGSFFGPVGEGFIRLNVACPTQALQAAIARLERALAQR